MDSNSQLPPHAVDILGCVYRFILNHAHDETAPQLRDGQILRGWQSLPTAPPFDEYCIITELSTVRHGTNAYKVEESATQAGMRVTAAQYEHLVQVDFLSSDAPAAAAASRHRVLITEMLLNAYYANKMFKELNPALSVLYCDAPVSLAEPDETHRLRQRHTLTLHIGQTVVHTMPIDIVETVRIEPRPLPRGNQEV